MKTESKKLRLFMPPKRGNKKDRAIKSAHLLRNRVFY